MDVFNHLELMPFGSSNISGCHVELAKANFRLGLNLDFSTKLKFLSFNESCCRPSDLDDEGLKPSLLCLKLLLYGHIQLGSCFVLLHSLCCH